jgi:DMSO/TMAO reductase YedYZ molybdopterin-dependent catalytic subunit
MSSTTSLVTPYLHKKPSSLRYYQDGPPKDVDLKQWKLSLEGLVGTELTLNYDDMLALPSAEENRRMVCVCNWSIRRTWKGVELATLMEMAGVRNPEKLYLKQISIGTREKGVYEATIPLGDAIARRALLIYTVDGDPLGLEQGFPLRLLDFGLYGYKSVKGLARLQVTERYELGEWERRAGYDIDGTIRPKKYWAVDLNTWCFVARPGEVTTV